MKVSLILATIGRKVEFAEYLESLVSQSHKNFEVIIVDQNIPGFLDHIIQNYKGKLDIKVISSAPGLSKARNVGISLVTGEIVGFPDDDCKYPPWLLAQIVELFCRCSSAHGLTGKTVPALPQVRPRSSRARRLNKINVWSLAISYTIFLRNHVVQAVGKFDEELGVGADSPWGAGEETDYLLRAMAKDFNIYFFNEISVQHPQKKDPAKFDAVRTFRYASGTGRVLKKNAEELGRGPIVYSLLRTAAMFIVALFTCRQYPASLYAISLSGKLYGYFTPRSASNL